MNSKGEFEILLDCIGNRCNQLGLKIEPNPKELQRTFVRSSQIIDDKALRIDEQNDISRGKQSNAQSIPNDIDCMYIDSAPLIISKLPSKIIDLNERLSELHHHAAISLTWLNEIQRPDLMIFFVGPKGSESISEWILNGRCIERDEFVCRKMVWLPPLGESNILQQSALSFLDRTFLARPWRIWESRNDVNLDATAGLFEENWKREWSKLLDSHSQEDSELVLKLTLLRYGLSQEDLDLCS